MNSLSYCLLVAICLSVADSEDKWVWGEGGSRSSGVAKPLVARASQTQSRPLFQVADSYKPAKARALSDYRDKESVARYEVLEGDSDLRGPESSFVGGPGPAYGLDRGRFPEEARPLGPLGVGRPLGPDGFSPGFRPEGLSPDLIRPEGVSPLRPGPRPGPNRAPGILTGPIPSWQRPANPDHFDPTHFDHCKCAFSFNCKSPGIQFGKCDEGKSYCCHNVPSKYAPPKGGREGYGTKYRPDGRPTLTGPDGPPFRPDFLPDPRANRPGYGASRGVLGLDLERRYPD